ncbi:KAP family P-loop NTPase fold protein [Pseudomonas sp. GR 6-02]|uniref:KAP family P-loop NTPase fold protein n=1 Tax=Pseudomonas sp. GR 6-02 TaxID=1659194 RepID=UPI0007DCD18F|nr:P-loop NTPase fold protein [Pseudomonas sp. GR 6-02]ANI60480.1 hypothetical protein PGR6_29070 [Pseudomonas sp. GR 6-02]
MQPHDSMPAVLDRQIANEQDDAFGHRHYAQALRSLVESERHQPPFSIGLLGGWGTGKSSIKELYTKGLEDDADAMQGNSARKNRFKSITFNAWRFGGKDQDIKRALLRHVFLELGGDEKTLHDKLFRNVTHTEQQWKGWKEYGLQLWRAWAMPLPAFVIAMGILLLFVWAGLQIAPADAPIVQSTLALILTVSYSYILKQLKPSKIDSFRSITKVSLPSASAEQYEEMLLEQLKEFKQPSKGFLSKTIPCERLVIFVDDLDRLSAEEMVLGLDAVRAFMEIPTDRLPKGLGLVFVISCDEAKVADALWRGRSHNPEQPGTVFSHNDARRYLDRIFQFRLEIPPPPRGDMRQFALKHLLTFTDIADDLNGKVVAAEQLIERMIHVNVVDPRNALQIVNAFAQSWWLAKRREQEGVNGRPGGLHDGAVTGYLESLAALSAAKVSFPDFYRDLQDDPEFLDRLTAVFVNDHPVLELPLDAQPLLLKRYVMLETDSKGGKTTKIREGCRELRQFLSSLVGIQWPVSLQSLLLLSEDPISRKFGSGTRIIYGLLVSGDTRGLIEHLSPRADQIMLSEDQARLLHQMIGELHLEPASRRHNAMRVVANLLNDLPPRTVRLVIGHLCTELAASSNLRSMVGVSKLASVLPLANSQQQQIVAAALVGDLCTEDAPFGLRLENMQTPSLDVAIDMAKAVAEIVLAVWKTQGLPAPQDQIFRQWLHTRSITVDGIAHSFPFSLLEEWIVSNEEMLLHTLGTDYATLLAVEVEAGRAAEINIPRAALRIGKLFEQMALAGEESRAELWPLVERYLSLTENDLKACAFTVLEQHHNLMSHQVLSQCLRKMTELLINHPDPSMDFDRGFRWLVQMTASRLDHLSEATKDSLLELIENITSDPYEDDAVALFEQLKRSDELLAKSAEGWVATLAGELPLKCCEALLKSYVRLPDDVKISIVAYLDSGFKTASLPARFDALYQIAVRAIPSTCWNEAELQSHLRTALSQLPSLVSRASNELSVLLQGLTQVYLNAEPPVVASGLENAFATAVSYPTQLNTLHKFFGEHWPSKDSVTPGNIPERIFNEAVTTMTSYPQEAKRDVLNSLQNMIEVGIVAPTHQPELITLACTVWQKHSAEAETFLAHTKASLTAAQVATLADAINWELEEEVERLEQIWNNVSQGLTAEEQRAATLLILAKGQQLGKTDLPDQCLSIWTRSLGMKAYSVLEQVMFGNGVTDATQRRLWRQIISLTQKPPAMALVELALKILEQASAPEVSAAVNPELKSITQHFTDQAERSGVASLLLKHVPRCPSIATKTNLADLAHSLGSPAVLKTVDATSLTEDDLKAIAEKFGEGRDMKSLRKRFDKAGG